MDQHQLVLNFLREPAELTEPAEKKALRTFDQKVRELINEYGAVDRKSGDSYVCLFDTDPDGYLSRTPEGNVFISIQRFPTLSFHPGTSMANFTGLSIPGVQQKIRQFEKLLENCDRKVVKADSQKTLDDPDR